MRIDKLVSNKPKCIRCAKQMKCDRLEFSVTAIRQHFVCTCGYRYTQDSKKTA